MEIKNMLPAYTYNIIFLADVSLGKYLFPIFGVSNEIPYFSSRRSITDAEDVSELKYFLSLLK